MRTSTCTLSTLDVVVGVVEAFRRFVDFDLRPVVFEGPGPVVLPLPATSFTFMLVSVMSLVTATEDTGLRILLLRGEIREGWESCCWDAGGGDELLLSWRLNALDGCIG